jgi:curved DNA-binding protein CbpA
VSSGAAPAPAPDSAPPEESPERAAIRMEVQSLHERLARIDHFEILGVGREAGAEEIRAAYLARVKRFHPDRADILGVPELKEEMEELVLRLREAQEVLLDPEQRRRHLDESAGKAPVDDQARDVVDRAVAAENAYQMAVALERQRRLKEAEVSAMKAVERCPEQGEYRCMLYWLQMAGRAPNASVTDLAVKALDASAKAPAHERAQWQAGKILLRAGRTEQAAECFRRVVGRNPQNVEAARELRLIDMRSGKKGGGGGILAKLLGKK